MEGRVLVNDVKAAGEELASLGLSARWVDIW